MPKGQKLIDWTAENDARLILTIIAVENLHPNCEAVAKAFGGSVNAMAISNRLSRLRKKAADEGLIPQGGPATTTKGNKSNGTSTKAKGGKKVNNIAEESESGTPPADHEGSISPATSKTPAKLQKILTGRVTKARGCAKKTVKDTDEILDRMGAEADEDGVEGSQAKDEAGEEDGDSANIKEEEAE